MAQDASQLNLRPIDESDIDAIRRILEQPELDRRQLFSGLKTIHPVAWSDVLKTFGVRLGDELFGTVELKRDEDDADTWELALVLVEHKRSLDGARSAVAALFYAFEVLNAAAVWFWVPESKHAVHTFAEEMNFDALNWIPVPGGGRARVYELNRAVWMNPTPPIMQTFFQESVVIADRGQAWRCDDGTFHDV